MAEDEPVESAELSALEPDRSGTERALVAVSRPLAPVEQELRLSEFIKDNELERREKEKEAQYLRKERERDAEHRREMESRRAETVSSLEVLREERQLDSQRHLSGLFLAVLAMISGVVLVVTGHSDAGAALLGGGLASAAHTGAKRPPASKPKRGSRRLPEGPE